MLSNVIIIYLKEMKEVLRDRKTLIFMLVLPTVVIPLLINGMMSFMMKAEKKARTETISYAIFGGDVLPDLSRKFIEDTGFELKELSSITDIADSIDNGTIKMALEIPADSMRNLEEEEQATVKLYFNNASMSSRVKSRASKLVKEYGEELRQQRLAGLGFDVLSKREALINPLLVEEKGTADMREIMGERVGGMLPYLFIIFAFMGALYPAIDLGNIISSVGSADLGLIGFMLFPTTAIFAALLMCVSIYAKSFKEAQSYATPLNFLAIIPAVMAMIPGVELNWTTAMIPITNVSLAIKELIKGTMDYTMLIAILGSSTLIALVAIGFCAKWFERESVLFRE